jgi:hypothetical protein
MFPGGAVEVRDAPLGNNVEDYNTGLAKNQWAGRKIAAKFF